MGFSATEIEMRNSKSGSREINYSYDKLIARQLLVLHLPFGLTSEWYWMPPNDEYVIVVIYPSADRIGRYLDIGFEWWKMWPFHNINRIHSIVFCGTPIGIWSRIQRDGRHLTFRQSYNWHHSYLQQTSEAFALNNDTNSPRKTIISLHSGSQRLSGRMKNVSQSRKFIDRSGDDVCIENPKSTGLW